MNEPVYLGFDTETFPIEPGLLAPPLVCASGCVAYTGDVDADGATLDAWLLTTDDALDTAENNLRSGNHLVIHNAPFDLLVLSNERPSLLPLVFQALDEDRIHCTKVRDMMLLIAKGELKEEGSGKQVGFHLSDLVQRRFNVDISDSKKNPDAWRLRYNELDGVPIPEWPVEAKTYAKDDAVWHLRVFGEQEGERAQWCGPDVQHASYAEDLNPPDPLEDEGGQTRAAFALHLMASYGVLTDRASVELLEEHLTATVTAAHEKLRASKILKGTNKKDKNTGLIGTEWSKDTALIKGKVEAGFYAQGLNAPRTDPTDRFPDGQVKMDEETLRASKDPDLLVLADVMADEKLLGTYVQALKGRMKKGNTKEYDQKGRILPDGWMIQSSWNVLVSSGRTSGRAPNWQNPPRKGGVMWERTPGEWVYVPGVRECVVPRKGFWFSSCDYSFVELVTWAQSCFDLFGFSDLRDAIVAGLDPHVDMGVEILRAETPVRELEYTDKMGVKWFEDSDHVDYVFVWAAYKAGAEWAAEARQLAKAANFGLPGGLGAATFCEYAWATYGVRIEEASAKKLKAIWRGKWREADPFFNHVASLQEAAFGQEFTVVLPRTGFVRGGCTFTSGCNTYFQGLAARGAKEAMWLLAQECYLGYSRLWTREEHSDEKSPLYGCRPVLFLHDEFILEVPADADLAHAAAMRQVYVMEHAMAVYCPDVPNKAEPTLMERWFKEAKQVYDEQKRLTLWRPKPRVPPAVAAK